MLGVEGTAEGGGERVRVPKTSLRIMSRLRGRKPLVAYACLIFCRVTDQFPGLGEDAEELCFIKRSLSLSCAPELLKDGGVCCGQWCEDTHIKGPKSMGRMRREDEE